VSQPKPHAKQVQSFEKCPKCEIRPSTPGRNRWCNECNAAYQREYQASREERMEGKGFAKGVDAMRREVSAHFEQFPFAKFAGHEIAKMIATIPAPRFQEPEKQALPEPVSNGAAAPQS
jgi:hypothetical protein